MSKKIKCIECAYSMNWALPERIGSQNIEYAKQCLATAERSIVCGETMKTKRIGHEQYCKKFKLKSEFDLRMNDVYQTEIGRLKEMIDTYEA